MNTKKIIIIAEIGINHNGDMDLAKKMISSAKDCGANIVKFQKRDINVVYSQEFLKEKRDSKWGDTQFDQKNGLEFTEKNYDTINEYCKSIKIDWFASAWDLNSLKFLDKYNSKYNKIASAMIVDKNFLNEVAIRKKHTFISTGMSTDNDIETAVNIFKKNNCPFELMHCVSAYPFDPEHANLQLINIMKKRYNCDVGYSGHEKGGHAVSYAATAQGISSIERHFTTDRTLYGSDQAASISPDGFSKLVGGVRIIEAAFSDIQEKMVLDIEKPVAKKLREHLKL
jgi:N-acetylneuraminate synthase